MSIPHLLTQSIRIHPPQEFVTDATLLYYYTTNFCTTMIIYYSTILTQK